MTNSGTPEISGQHVLTKTLRDGLTVLAIYIEPDGNRPSTLAYWLAVYLDGELIARCKNGPRPLAGRKGDITHGMNVRSPRRGEQTFGMTTAEAETVAAVTAGWIAGRQEKSAQARAARIEKTRAAVPGAATSVYSGPDTYLCRAGETVRIEDGSYITGLDERREYITEDGWSLGLQAERGYLYHSTVREATPDEVAALKADRA